MKDGNKRYERKRWREGGKGRREIREKKMIEINKIHRIKKNYKQYTHS